MVEEESEVIGLDSVLWTDRAAVEGMVHRQAELMEERWGEGKGAVAYAQQPTL